MKNESKRIIEMINGIGKNDRNQEGSYPILLKEKVCVKPFY